MGVSSKTYTTENAYRSHINSKKHKENELKALSKSSSPPLEKAEIPVDEPTPVPEEPKPTSSKPTHSVPVSLTIDAKATEAEINQTIDEKIAVDFNVQRFYMVDCRRHSREDTQIIDAEPNTIGGRKTEAQVALTN